MEFSTLLERVDGIFSSGSSLVEVHKAVRDLHVFDRELSDKGIVDYSGNSAWSVRVCQSPVSYVLRRRLVWNGHNRVALPDEACLDEFLECLSFWESQQARGSEVSLGLQRFFEHEVAVDGSAHFEGSFPYAGRSLNVYAILKYPPVSLDVRVALAPVSQSKVA